MIKNNLVSLITVVVPTLLLLLISDSNIDTTTIPIMIQHVDAFTPSLSSSSSSSVQKMRSSVFIVEEVSSNLHSSFTSLSNRNNNNRRGNVQLFLFKRIFGGGNKDKNDNDDSINNKNNNSSKNIILEDDNNETIHESAITTTQEEPSTVSSTSSKSSTKQLTALEQAQILRAQAERARLEAEKMDVMLTLQKIEKLELELEKNKKGDKKSSSNSTTDNQDDIKIQIEALKKKLNSNDDTNDNEPILKEEVTRQSPSVGVVSNTKTNDVDSVILSVIEEAKKKPIDSLESPQSTSIKTTTSKPLSSFLSSEEIESRLQKFNNAPIFMKELVVSAAGMDMDNLNTTALILKLDMDEKLYNEKQEKSHALSKEDNPMPDFSQEQIDEVVEAVKLVPQFVKNLYGEEIKNNDTAIALLMLEEEWKEGKIVAMPEITQQMIDDKLEEVKWVPQFLRGDNDTELALELIKMDFKNNPKKFRDQVLGLSDDEKKVGSEGKDKSKISSEEEGRGIFSSRLFGNSLEEQIEEKTASDALVENLFPKSTRREGEEPSENDLKVAMTEVFAKDNVWTVSQQPEQVPGGFIVRGYTKYDTGKELMETIDKNLEKSKLGEKLSVFYVFDPTPVTEEQMDSGERPPVLFVTGPKVVRDPEPIQRSIISSLALGFVWYNSLIPYLLNDKFMKLADEQLALADASMPANLDFLNDLSFPLFLSMIGIQVAHEVAHSITAKVNGLQISFPTLVPSLESGLTGAITSLQSPPKDKQSLFDFAISGPLAGILVSIILMYTGMFLSSSMDAASFSNLPALPLTLLRQSSLGGGIIDSVTPGLLSIPDAALGTKALSDINIPLHPLTIAGYLGLMINAINLLPVGRTDGGRVSLTLFGRSGTQLVNLIVFLGLFIGGVLGSDFFLLFFSYVIFFQSEPEIPQRNEVDDMDFSRVILATVTGVVTLLTLIPM